MEIISEHLLYKINLKYEKHDFFKNYCKDCIRNSTFYNIPKQSSEYTFSKISKSASNEAKTHNLQISQILSYKFAFINKTKCS